MLCGLHCVYLLSVADVLSRVLRLEVLLVQVSALVIKTVGLRDYCASSIANWIVELNLICEHGFAIW